MLRKVPTADQNVCTRCCVGTFVIQVEQPSFEVFNRHDECLSYSCRGRRLLHGGYFATRQMLEEAKDLDHMLRNTYADCYRVTTVNRVPTLRTTGGEGHLVRWQR